MQMFCGNGHSWMTADMADARQNSCPQCQQNGYRADLERSKLAEVIKQAVLDALREFKKDFPKP